MHKIPTLFQRDPENRKYVLPEVTPGCEWVLAGEGVATRKWDGTCTMLDEAGKWWARREVKPGKAFPENYVVVSHDEVTGKTMGWEPMAQSSFVKFHAEALESCGVDIPGTYELIGPKINGDPDKEGAHMLMPHGWAPPENLADAAGAPRTFDALRDWLQARPWEGLVWHHPDGRMTKLKARDFPQV